MIHMRSFTPFEEDNLAFLVNMGIKFTQVEITPTGLDKGILDSTVPMRTFFKENRIHDYESQNQGQENKVVKNAVILTECSMMKTKVSFYRPNTKKGDPRMWIYKLGSFSQGNDIHTLIWYDKTLYSINITRINIKEVFESVLITPIQELLKVMSKENSSVADELLEQGVALTVYSPKTQELTISMRENEWLNRMVSVWLIDKATGAQIDLLESDYSFSAEAGTTAGRFILMGAFFAPQITTDNGTVQGDEDIKAKKFIYKDKMYIQINGVIYDATGKLVK